MPAVLFTDRLTLRTLHQNHPDWSASDFAAILNCSLSWVKKWLARFRTADPTDETVLHGQSQAPQTRPARTSPTVIAHILDIRDPPRRTSSVSLAPKPFCPICARIPIWLGTTCPAPPAPSTAS